MNSANPPPPPPEQPPLDVGGLIVKNLLAQSEFEAIALEQYHKLQVANANKGAFPWPRGAYDGLTKREYFAAAALNGLCSRGLPYPEQQEKLIAQAAVRLADLTLAALENHDSPR